MKAIFGSHFPITSNENRQRMHSKTSAYEEGLLIAKFISLMRALGRFPVVVKISMMGRQGPGFPNDKTFGRFGPKPECAATILEYSRSTSTAVKFGSSRNDSKREPLSVIQTQRKWGIHRIATIGQRNILQQKGEWAASVPRAPQ
jgi:hypothetical protein